MFYCHETENNQKSRAAERPGGKKQLTKPDWNVPLRVDSPSHYKVSSTNYVKVFVCLRYQSSKPPPVNDPSKTLCSNDHCGKLELEMFIQLSLINGLFYIFFFFLFLPNTSFNCDCSLFIKELQTRQMQGSPTKGEGGRLCAKMKLFLP